MQGAAQLDGRGSPAGQLRGLTGELHGQATVPPVVVVVVVEEGMRRRLQMWPPPELMVEVGAVAEGAPWCWRHGEPWEVVACGGHLGLWAGTLLAP